MLLRLLVRVPVLPLLPFLVRSQTEVPRLISRLPTRRLRQIPARLLRGRPLPPFAALRPRTERPVPQGAVPSIPEGTVPTLARLLQAEGIYSQSEKLRAISGKELGSPGTDESARP